MTKKISRNFWRREENEAGLAFRGIRTHDSLMIYRSIHHQCPSNRGHQYEEENKKETTDLNLRDHFSSESTPHRSIRVQNEQLKVF